MKIYTRRGDDGTTGLFGTPERVSKDARRVAAYGELDELNAVLGVARAACAVDSALSKSLARLQDELFVLGAELATPDGVAPPKGLSLVGPADIERMEREIDAMDLELPELTTFILPGGAAPAAALHVARAVSRRAERAMVGLAAEGHVRPEALAYVNRLSDLLFTMARAANHRAGADELAWHPR